MHKRRQMHCMSEQNLHAHLAFVNGLRKNRTLHGQPELMHRETGIQINSRTCTVSVCNVRPCTQSLSSSSCPSKQIQASKCVRSGVTNVTLSSSSIAAMSRSGPYAAVMSVSARRAWMDGLPFSKHALLVNLVDLGCGKKTTSGSGKKTTGVRAFVPPDLIVRANNCP